MQRDFCTEYFQNYAGYFIKGDKCIYEKAKRNASNTTFSGYACGNGGVRKIEKDF